MMTRLNYILIVFFGGASVLSLVFQNSAGFLAVYFGMFGLALFGLLFWGSVKLARFVRSELDREVVIDRLKSAFFLVLFLALPIILIFAPESHERSIDTDTQYDHLRGSLRR